ncbi:dihydroxy-acid dehydratase [Candidatus Micrarchaeota archaeon]|nr:dihydroxy-acid dehydratase [Candidatus Micrarchaeota archaeon]
MALALKHESAKLTEGLERAPGRAMMRGAGFSGDQLAKPFGIVVDAHNASTTCNMHLGELAESAAKAFADKGWVVHRARTAMVTDGTAMGNEVMKFSLPSRDVIADSAEVSAKSVGADCFVGIGGCDKTTPGMLMAMATLNMPAVYLYGGTIEPGHHKGKPVDIVSMFEGVGQVALGKIREGELVEMECEACPSAGACGGMYTANTMASCTEALGMSLPGSASTPAVDPRKKVEAYESAVAVTRLLEQGIRPKDILTKKAFENAIAVMTVLAGSTNAFLHLPAIAKRAGVNLSLSDFERIRERTPTLADLKPSGRFVMADLHRVGGVQAVMKLMLEAEWLHKDALTVTGKTLEENLERAPKLTHGQEVIRPLDEPIKPRGHFRVVYGNLAPLGAVFKIGSWPHETFTGPARVFEKEEQAMKAVMDGKVKEGDVMVTRYEGPRGGPGMREQLSVTAALAGRGLHEKVLVVTDGRFSGGTRMGVCHVCPEAQNGGSIALVVDGDEITLDLKAKTLDLHVEESILGARKKKWTAPQPLYASGILSKYAKHATEACFGAMME